jgi:hypothetical protein
MFAYCRAIKGGHPRYPMAEQQKSGFRQIQSLILCLLILQFFACRASAENLIWKQEESLAQVTEAKCVSSQPTGENDCYFEGYVFQSRLGPKFFYTLVDHAGRVSLSFVGSLLDDSLPDIQEQQTQFNTLQMMNSPFDWGGLMMNGKFKPLFAIKRIIDPEFSYETDKPDSSKTGLIVWRLPGDGIKTNCVLGIARTNREAREIAQRNYPRAKCPY